MYDVEQLPRIVNVLWIQESESSLWICYLDPNERHESCTEILDAHDIADAVVPVPWTCTFCEHVHLMEPTAHMHHDADGARLNERVEAVDCGVPI